MEEFEDDSPANTSFKSTTGYYAKKRPKRLPWNVDVPKNHFIPQTYQIQLVELALRNNLIIFVRNSELKAYLNTMILRENCLNLEPHKKLILVAQVSTSITTYYELLKRHLNISIGIELNLIDSLNEAHCTHLKNTSQLLILGLTQTSEWLKRGYLHPAEIKLLIFDEIHTSLHNTIYNQIMSHISPATHILCFSTLILKTNTNPNELTQRLNYFSELFRCQIETASDVLDTPNMLTSNHIKESIELFETVSKNTKFTADLTKILRDCADFLRGIDLPELKKLSSASNIDYIHLICEKLVAECLYLIDSVGVWCFAKSLLPFISQLDKLATYLASNSFEYEYALIQLTATRMRQLREMCVREIFTLKKEPKPSQKVDKLLNVYCTPKVKALVSLLRAKSTSTQDLCCLVYVQNKQVAISLSLLLKKLSKEDHRLGYLSPNYVLSSSTASQDQNLNEPTGGTNDFLKQEEIIRKFHSGHINLLVCTYDMEEVIQVPTGCNLIIHFDTGKLNYFSYIMSKRRLRYNPLQHHSPVTRHSRLVYLCEKSGFERFFAAYSNFKCIENTLTTRYSLLLRLNAFFNNHPPPNDENTSSKFAYKTPKSTLNLSNSIEILNRYCVRLPSDALTQLTVDYSLHLIDSKYICRLHLPVNSAVDEPISSDPFDSAHLSMRHAAFRACCLLHAHNELSDDFEPITKELFYRQQYANHFPIDQNPPKTQTQAGSKRKQIYLKKVSDYLHTSTLDTSHATYLYLFKFTLTKCLSDAVPPTTDPANKSTDLHFALLTQKMLLEVPDYTIFTQQGEETIDIRLLRKGFFLTPNQIKLVRSFHKFIFSHVLRMQRSPLVYKEASNGAYLCLVRHQTDTDAFEIDWNLMRSVDNCDDKAFLANNRTEKFEFDRHTFEDSVVIPYYRSSDFQPQFYCVQSIDYSQTPLSTFPSNNLTYPTFYDYYTMKYGQVITNTDQPLLVVTHPSTRLNLLTPRYMNLKACVLQKSTFHTRASSSHKSSQHHSNKIFLLPELVNVHPFAASLWKRCLCMPSVLYRLNYLLLAEELRREIAQATGIGVPWVSDGCKFDKLEFFWDANKEIEVSNVPDVEVDPLSASESAVVKESDVTAPSDDANGWNFEISHWDDSCVAKAKSAKPGNGWLDFGTDENGTLFIDVNDLAFFDDNMSMDGWSENENEATGDRAAADFAANCDEEEEDENAQQVHEVFTINLTNLKADLKHKSAKLMSRLNVSSTEINTLLAKTPQAGHVVPTTKGDESDEGLFKYYTDAQLMLLKNEFETSLDLAGDKGKLGEDCGVGSVVANVDESFVWLKGVDLSLANLVPAETDVDFDRIKKLKERLESMNKGSENEVNEMVVDLGGVNRVEFRNYEIFAKPKSSVERRFDEELPGFSLDYRENDLNEHEGPGPACLLQALTLSNASDGFDLERLETVGDSFLKQAVTVYLYCTYPKVNEGKLSYLRSKQVSNYNLYRLGVAKKLPELIVSAKFEPLDSWLPLHYDVKYNMTFEQILSAALKKSFNTPSTAEVSQPKTIFDKYKNHVVSDKSVADCVEAIIGAYLITSGPQAALRVMNWFGLKVLPKVKSMEDGSEIHVDISIPVAPVIRDARKLDYLLDGFEKFEETIGYRFKTRAYLLQAFTHASYYFNDVTDCYQRLEFLGDAILDYVITRHLYEDPKRHSPGELTDLRSSLVNNNIFAYLAVKFEFYKYFKYLSSEVHAIIEQFVSKQKQQFDLDEDFLLLDFPLDDDDEEFLVFDEAGETNGGAQNQDETPAQEFEELEVPKCLGDIFESVAGAIFLDSGKSFDAVWRVYYGLMKPYIEKYTAKVPKSPIRELLELEPETAKFEKPERTIDGKIRVTVSVFGKGKFKGVGRNYRIAKNAAAKHALKFIKKET